MNGPLPKAARARLDAPAPFGPRATGGFAAMRKPYWLACLIVLALTAVGSAAPSSPAAAKAGGERRSSLGTIRGTVLDSRGNPVAGALGKNVRAGPEIG